MNSLRTLRDADVFPHRKIPLEIQWKDRPSARVVVFNDEGEIALLGNNANEYLELPGGGVEGEETPAQCAIRECLEETGCEIEIVGELGCIDDYRSREGRHCIHFGFIGKVLSHTGVRSLTAAEAFYDKTVHWVTVADALATMKKQEGFLGNKTVTFYNTGFNMLRDSFFVQKLRK